MKGVPVLLSVPAFVTPSAVILPLPELGIRPDMVGELARDSGGQWVEEPHRAVVFAMLYFTATAWSGAYSHRWMHQAGS